MDLSGNCSLLIKSFPPASHPYHTDSGPPVLRPRRPMCRSQARRCAASYHAGRCASLTPDGVLLSRRTVCRSHVGRAALTPDGVLLSRRTVCCSHAGVLLSRRTVCRSRRTVCCSHAGRCAALTSDGVLLSRRTVCCSHAGRCAALMSDDVPLLAGVPVGLPQDYLQQRNARCYSDEESTVNSRCVCMM